MKNAVRPDSVFCLCIFLTVFKQKVVRIFSGAPTVNDSDRLITDHDIPQKAQSAIKDEV
jgi:hypothetical protein